MDASPSESSTAQLTFVLINVTVNVRPGRNQCVVWGCACSMKGVRPSERQVMTSEQRTWNVQTDVRMTWRGLGSAWERWALCQEVSVCYLIHLICLSLVNSNT